MSLKPVVFAKYPMLTSIHDKLAGVGGWCAHLTGSGPTFYISVPNADAGEQLRQKLLADSGLFLQLH